MRDERLHNIDTSSWAFNALIGQLVEWTPSAPIRKVSATANVNPQDGWIRADATSAAIVLTLETAVGCDGRIHWFNKVDSSTNTVTLTPDGSETIGGESSLVLAAKNDAVILCSNGENWEVMAASGETFEGGEVTPVGGGGVSAWARVAADGTVLASEGVSSVSRSSEGVYLVNIETAASTVSSEIQMSVVATPATVVGDGGEGVRVLKEFSAYASQATDSNTAGKSYFYSSVTGNVYELGSTDNVVYVYDADTFGTPTTIALGTGNGIRNTASYEGCMDYEGEVLWLSSDNSESIPLLGIDLATETVTEFADAPANGIVVAAKDGNVYVVDGGSVVKKFTPDIGTAVFGTGTTVINATPLGTNSPRGCWDSNGHLWVTGPSSGGVIYQVTPSVTVEHLYPDTGLYAKCQPVFDSIRGVLYIAIGNATDTVNDVYRYSGWNAAGAEDSGQWSIVIPNQLFNSLSYDASSDVLFCENYDQALIHRYDAGSMQRVDSVAVSSTSAQIPLSMRPNKTGLYFDDTAFFAATDGSDEYLVKASYAGDEIDFSGSGKSVVSSVLHALTDVVDTDTAKVQLFRSTNPIIRADGEFSVHIMTDKGGGSSSGGDSSSTISGVFGQVQLTLNSTNLQLAAYKGNALTFADGVTATISSALTLAPTGLSASTLYYIYATRDGTTVDAIEASTTTYSTTNGIRHKNGDTALAFVGMARTNADAEWVDTAYQRFVRSHFNDPGVSLRQITTQHSSSSGSAQEWGDGANPVRLELLAWAGEKFTFSFFGYVSNSANGGDVSTEQHIDGVSLGDNSISTVRNSSSSADEEVGFSMTSSVTLTEGYHYAGGKFYATGGTGTVRGTLTGMTTGAP